MIIAMPCPLRRNALVVFVILVATCSQHRDPVLQEVIVHARRHALNAPRVDWPRAEAEAHVLSREAGGEEGRLRAIHHVLRALGDRHSTYVPAARLAAAPATAGSPAAPLPIAESREPREGFGHLVIHAWSSPFDGVPEATLAVRHALNEALRHDACGLIIDVAGNHGGNMWPMMGGIAPLYDEGTLETFERRDGTRNAINVAEGVLRTNDKVSPDVPGLPAVAREPRFIAVVIGGRTASSGEILALGFRYQDNVRLFGTSTRGATTSNSTIPLSNGALLALTTSRILDRKGIVQEGPLFPDEPTHDSLGAAAAWLRMRCSETGADEIAGAAWQVTPEHR